MTNQKHTPGPWYVANGCGVYAQIDSGAVPESRSKPRLYSESKANARLIAAAPDLLRVCEEVFDRLSAWNDSLNCWENQRALTDAEKNQKANYLKLVGILERAIIEAKGQS